MAVYTWSTGNPLTIASGIWSFPAWTLNGVFPVNAPTASDSALFTVAINTYTVVLTGDQSIVSVSVNHSAPTIQIGSNTLHVLAAGSAFANLGTVTLAAGTLDGNGTISLGGGTGRIQGSGVVNMHIGTLDAGGGLVIASGGTLTLNNTLDSGVHLAIDTSIPSRLNIQSLASIPGSMALANPNQTLGVMAGGQLVLAGGLAASGGTIDIRGGTISAAGGINLSGGGRITGFGTIADPLAGTGSVLAIAGALAITDTITNTTTLGFGDKTGTLALGTTYSFPSALTFGSGNELDVLAAGTVTIGSTQGLDNVVGLSGGTLTDAAGFVLNVHANITGFGRLVGPVSASSTLNAGTITASGGTLDVMSSVASGVFLDLVGTADLRLNASSTLSRPLTLDAGQTLELPTSSTLTATGTITGQGGRVQLAGGALSASALDLSGTSVNGFGRLTGTVSTSGVIRASGGALSVNVTAPGTQTLLIDSNTSSTLSVLGSLTTAPISLGGPNQHLDIAGGLLNIAGQQTITVGTITMSGGTLTGTGIGIGTGTAISGFGTVSAPLSGLGKLIANGGTMVLGANPTAPIDILVQPVAGNRLQVPAGVTATLGQATMTQANQVVGIAGTVSVSGTQAISGGAQMLMQGGTLGGILSLGGTNAISGSGTITAALRAAGGSVQAQGGRLVLSGSIDPLLGLALSGTAALALNSNLGPHAPLTINANQTLEIGASATINAFQAVTGGTIMLASGGTLVPLGGLALSGGVLSAQGSSQVTGGVVTGNGSLIVGSGATLTLGGATTLDSIPVQLGSGAPTELRLLGATRLPTLALTSANQTVNAAATNDVQTLGTTNLSGGHLALHGGTFSGAPIVLSAGDIVGSGVIVNDIQAAGTGGTIRASNGTLTLAGIIASSETLAIDSATPSTLRIDSASTTISPTLSLNDANQRLRVSAGAAITFGTPQTWSNAAVDMAGGTLIGSFTNTAVNLSGSGTLSGARFATTGTVTATGGLLRSSAGLFSAGLLAIDTVAGSAFQLDNSASLSVAPLTSANQLLAVGTGATLTSSSPLSVAAGVVSVAGALALTSGVSIGAQGQLALPSVTGGLGASDVTLLPQGTLLAAGSIPGTGNLLFSGQGLVVASGSQAPSLRLGAMQLTDTVQLTGLLTGASGKFAIDAVSHTIQVPNPGNPSQPVTFNVGLGLTDANASFFVTRDDNNVTRVTGVPKHTAGAVTVRAAGGLVQSIPIDADAALAVAQPLANPISTGIQSAAIPSNVHAPGSPIPALGSGQTGQIFITRGDFFAIPTGYTSVFDNAPDVATILGGAANGQLVVSGQGGLLYNAGAGSGTVVAGGGNNLLSVYPGSGDHRIYAGDGNDTVIMLAGNDFAAPGAGNNMILTGAGSDTIQSEGTDLIAPGDVGNVTITAAANNPTAFFGAGNTVFNAGSGHATTVSFNNPGLPNFGNATINGQGNTQIWLGSGRDVVNSTGADTIIGASGAATINATSGNDFVFAGTGALDFRGGSGASTVLGNAAGSASLSGGGGSVIALSYGAMRFTGGSGAATVAGFGGSLTVQGGSGGGIFLGGPAGNNSITAGSGAAIILGGGGGDTLVAGPQGATTIKAGSGAETIDASASSGFNQLFAGTGPNLIRTGTSNTAVQFGTGAATVVPGGGIDLYAFVSGNNNTVSVQGFNPALQFLHLSGFAGGAEATAKSTATVAGGNTTLALSDGTRITLLGYSGPSASITFL